VSTSAASGKTRAGTAAYVAPFLVLIVLLGVSSALGVPQSWAYPIRTAAVAAALALSSRRVIDLRARRPFASVLLGLAVFALWIGPGLLWPGYREHWLFDNPLLRGGPAAAPDERASISFLFFRISGSALVVPLAEELFWRGWMMRWLISPHFEEIPLGTYAARAFWITAVLFASEHGAFWDVGLVAGVAFNTWMIRTRSLADCILAHAVTNAALAGCGKTPISGEICNPHYAESAGKAP
jgi:CAAX prenyl protease-like protein